MFYEDIKRSKKRKDYSFKEGFKGEGLSEKEFIKIMRKNNTNGYFADSPSCTKKNYYKRPDSSEGYCGLFVMEIGYVDIELHLYSKDDSCKGKEWTPDIAFFVCKKFGNGEFDWESHSFIDEELSLEEVACNIDWTKNNWKDLLEEDMFKKISLFVERKNWNINNPII